ncbi:terpenoid synthase [Artomyces pyxidatus]|uniref:Terpenoid synthase n=1 Tax=Artomyces pyxidatus TaxID=48021 RepID=A0ACB8TFR0_9AGAM|nr:terpenoid synthase [Artomyces pyxidatus]
MSAPSQICLPNPLARWPIPRRLNPHYAEVKAESIAWIHSFQAFGPKSQKAFDRCDFSLLASLVYPTLDKGSTGCDLMMLFFVFDEFTDQVDGDGVQAYVEIVLDALRNPHEPRPKGEHVLGEISRQFFELAIKTASPSSQRHFIESFAEYVNAVIEEADDRVHDRVRNIEDYLSLRRQTAGPYPSYFPCELNVDLPDEVISHPTIANLMRWVAESIALTNDVYSYNIEQAAGHHAHNIVTVVMRDLGISIEGALEWVGKYHAELLERFVEACEDLSSFGSEELDAQVAEYVQAIAHGVRGLDSWCFESGRYFGDKGLEVQKHRVVNLLPKVGKDVTTPMMARLVAAVGGSS